MSKRIVIAAALALGVGFVIGRGCVPAKARTGAADTGALQVPGKVEIWTCSMHPQIRQPAAGPCPLCGMDLIPATTDASAATNQPRQVTLSPAARKLAEVAVAPVERRSFAVEIRMSGKVQFDETRLAYIAPRVSGRIDRLYANFAGMPVKPGDHLADMYSPELVAAQQELLLAAKATGGEAASAALLHATRERLRLWGLTAEQVAAIEQSGQVRDHVTFYAPIGGIVVEKEAREGQYVEAGMRLFTVADLTRVWVQLDAYESDLAWLRYAQQVTFQAEAYAGETFMGTIAFIAPLLDPMTRTVQVRVNVSNADGRLKPEMFVRAVVRAGVDGNGHVTRSDLRGKWISPMHPEIVKDGPGACDVCGMALVRAEDLGYAAPDDARGELPLVIPASAALVTGKRAVVYVAVPDAEGTYEGREVILGPRAGDYYLVHEGLQEGELVVINGNFKIDSSLQIQGKPSMMAPTGDAAPAGHAHGQHVTQPAARTPKEAAAVAVVPTPNAFRQQLAGVLDPVLDIGDALADDDLRVAAAAAAKAKQALATVDASQLAEAAGARWMASAEALDQMLSAMTAARAIEPFRMAFGALSSELARVVKTFAPLRAEPVYELHCPMAFDDRGAAWLQRSPAVRNPYFGKAMLACGELTETIPLAARAPAAAGDHAHE